MDGVWAACCVLIRALFGTAWLKGRKVIYTTLSFFTVLAVINAILRHASYWDCNEPVPPGAKHSVFIPLDSMKAEQYNNHSSEEVLPL